MASNIESSLRVSLHASEDLRRSLNSSHSSSNSAKLSPRRWGEGQGLNGSRSSGVSLWGSTVSSNTWPRSPKSVQLISSAFLSSPTTRFRSARSSLTSSCTLHSRGDGPDICPFDSSKYRLKPLPMSPSSRSLRSSLPLSPASDLHRSQNKYGWSSMSGIPDVLHYGNNEEPLNLRVSRGAAAIDDGLDELMAEIEEVFQESTYKSTPFSERVLQQTGGLSRSFVSNSKQENGEYLYVNGNLSSHIVKDDHAWRNEESFLDNKSSCRIKEVSNFRKVPCSYGNLSLSSSKFPSRISLQSTGSQETESSGAIENPKAITNGRKFRMQLEAKYEQYRETSPPPFFCCKFEADAVDVYCWCMAYD
ncbi:hypothetical protein ElyMa_003167300 [Elysia marginata]|uniref:Uncharacterized protein n=1 Tax=Elysia marginata TaxID=1093978 RepID=A0AAV4IY33_9GAST|nr:hypothetical protein ElyMa_003167300 [Elysia marginata]